MSAGTPLVRGPIERFRSAGAFGKPVYQSHVQLRAMLKAKRGERFADYFARPSVEAGGAEIAWTAERAGPVRRWQDLPPDEQALRALDLEVIRSGLASFVAELRAQGSEGSGGGAAAFASLLEQAMKVPADGDFLHVVGDQPVIVFWGFESPAGASVDPAAGLAPASKPPGAAARVGVNDAAGAASSPAAPAAETAPAPGGQAVRDERERRPRRRWLWWLLLLLLLLLALAAWWFHGRGPQAGPLLAIPPGALERGDLAFLEGDWQLGDGRLSTYEGKPDNVIGSDRIVFRFGADGQGRNLALEREQRGRSVPDCSGPLSARTDGKKLYFERGACAAPGNAVKPLSASRHECVLEGSKTMCYGVNEDGVRWDTPLHRLQ